MDRHFKVGFAFCGFCAGALVIGATITTIASLNSAPAPNALNSDVAIAENILDTVKNTDQLRRPEGTLKSKQLDVQESNKQLDAQTDDQKSARKQESGSNIIMALIQKAGQKAEALEAASGAPQLYNKIKTELAEIQNLRNTFDQNVDILLLTFQQRFDAISHPEGGDSYYDATVQLGERFNELKAEFDDLLTEKKDNLSEDVEKRFKVLSDFETYEYKDYDYQVDPLFEALEDNLSEAEQDHNLHSKLLQLKKEQRAEYQVLVEAHRQESANNYATYKVQKEELKDQYQAAMDEFAKLNSYHRERLHELGEKSRPRLSDLRDTLSQGLDDLEKARSQLNYDVKMKHSRQKLNNEIQEHRERNKCIIDGEKQRCLEEAYNFQLIYHRNYLMQATRLAKLWARLDSYDMSNYVKMMYQNEGKLALRLRKIRDKQALLRLGLLNN